MEKIMDLSKVREVLMDDKEEIHSLLKLFLSTMPEFLENLDRSIHNNDTSSFKFALHKFKSSCQFVASPVFIEKIKTFEGLEIKDLKEHTSGIDHLKAITLQLKQEIEGYLEVNEGVND